MLATKQVIFLIFIAFALSFTTVSCRHHMCSAYSSVNRTEGLKVRKKKQRKPRKRVRQKSHQSGLWEKRMQKRAKHK